MVVGVGVRKGKRGELGDRLQPVATLPRQFAMRLPSTVGFSFVT